MNTNPVFLSLRDKEIWDKVFKHGLSKFCGRQTLKSLKGYSLLADNISSNFLKAVFSKIYLVDSWMLCLICDHFHKLKPWIHKENQVFENSLNCFLTTSSQYSIFWEVCPEISFSTIFSLLAIPESKNLLRKKGTC